MSISIYIISLYFTMQCNFFHLQHVVNHQSITVNTIQESFHVGSPKVGGGQTDIKGAVFW
jgi:hypothetical protein